MSQWRGWRSPVERCGQVIAVHRSKRPPGARMARSGGAQALVLIGSYRRVAAIVPTDMVGVDNDPAAMTTLAY